MKSDLIIEGARQNNLKNISLSIPHDRLTVITGLSGSGKSSLAFDTIFAEGQWRYIESLSTYARMFLEKIDRPNVDAIRNVRPAIALEQRNPVRTSRSTVGTVTEIYDYLRLLFSKIGRLFCPRCGTGVKRYHASAVVEVLLREQADKKIQILFPVPIPEGEFNSIREDLIKRGFGRIKMGGEIFETAALHNLVGNAKEIQVLIDRIVVKSDVRARMADSVEIAFREGRGEVLIDIANEQSLRYTQALQCMQCGMPFDTPQPLLFSFNHPLGACKECNGFGNILQYDEDLIVPDKSLSLKAGALEPWTKPSYRWWMKQLLAGAKASGIDPRTPYQDLSPELRALLFQGSDDFHGLNHFFEELGRKRYKLHVRVFLSRYRSAVPCPSCRGARLRPEALHYLISGLNITQVSAMPVEALTRWFSGLSLSDFEQQASREILRQIEMKLSFFLRVGLGYLTIDRRTRTLSGGEAQRVNLSNQLASRLMGTLYILDEPSIGLHARDTGRLTEIVQELARVGNTVVIVEHDKALIESADHIVEMGPGAGERGGRVMFAGTKSAFLKSSCVTAKYLRGDESIPVPLRRRKQERRFLELWGASGHNLKNIDVRIPLQSLTCVTGVSGSGKSTLVQDTLYRGLARAFKTEFAAPGKHRELNGLDHIKGVKLIDQEPIGKSPRSNPVTYVKAFDLIRKVFSDLPDAKRMNLSPGHFSFNVPGGRCEACEGAGVRKIEMYFFEDMYVTCDACRGKRYKPHIQKVLYKGRSISQVLEMTVDEAVQFFSLPSLQSRLQSLAAVGLGYLRLGQPATTLSGGESQRLKISHELGDRGARDTVYILDEPTTGLHAEDIKKLLLVLGALVDAGNTVVVVEHNLDVIKTADWIIDLGPEGGERGGQLVAQGTPEDVVLVTESHTGRFLKEYLSR